VLNWQRRKCAWIPSAIAKLRQTNFFVSAEILNAALERDRCRRGGTMQPDHVLFPSSIFYLAMLFRPEGVARCKGYHWMKTVRTILLATFWIFAPAACCANSTSGKIVWWGLDFLN